MSNEWVDRHRGYSRNTNQARRLSVVRARIREALDRCPTGPIRVISLCAGDGRDLLRVLASHARARDVHARLVDVTPELATRGRQAAARLGLPAVEFVCDDAGTTSAYAGAVPADLVLVCGVFGNLTDDDVRRTLELLPDLCGPKATVVWTRGRFEPDLTPRIRSWFRSAGFEELSFVSVPRSTATVGAHRLAIAPRRFRGGRRIFTFLPRAARPSTGAEPRPAGSARVPESTRGHGEVSRRRRR